MVEKAKREEETYLEEEAEMQRRSFPLDPDNNGGNEDEEEAETRRRRLHLGRRGSAKKKKNEEDAEWSRRMKNKNEAEEA